MSYDPPTSSHVPVYTDGSNAMAADLDAGGNRIVNGADPVDPQDFATKNYVDTAGAGSGLTLAESLRLVSLGA